MNEKATTVKDHRDIKFQELKDNGDGERGCNWMGLTFPTVRHFFSYTLRSINLLHIHFCHLRPVHSCLFSFFYSLSISLSLFISNNGTSLPQDIFFLK